MSATPPREGSHPLGAEGAEVQALFGRIAGRYDFLNRALSFGQDALWRRRLARALALGPESAVLDLCCGTGDMALDLARASRASVVAVDFALPMLELARDKVASRPQAGQVGLVAGDGLRLPFADATFDAATVTFGIRNLADRDRGLAEIRRVLRPGGALGMLEFLRPEPGLSARLGAWYRRSVLPRLAAALGGEPAAYRYLPSTVDAFDSASEFAERLRAAGYAIERSERHAFGVVSLIVARATGGGA